MGTELTRYLPLAVVLPDVLESLLLGLEVDVPGALQAEPAVVHGQRRVPLYVLDQQSPALELPPAQVARVV